MTEQKVPQEIIDVAHKHAMLQAEVVKEEFQTGILVCQDSQGQYRYFDDAQRVDGMKILAVVDKCGKVKPPDTHKPIHLG